MNILGKIIYYLKNYNKDERCQYRRFLAMRWCCVLSLGACEKSCHGYPKEE